MTSDPSAPDRWVTRCLSSTTVFAHVFITADTVYINSTGCIHRISNFLLLQASCNFIELIVSATVLMKNHQHMVASQGGSVPQARMRKRRAQTVHMWEEACRCLHAHVAGRKNTLHSLARASISIKLSFYTFYSTFFFLKLWHLKSFFEKKNCKNMLGNRRWKTIKEKHWNEVKYCELCVVIGQTIRCRD